MVMQIAAGIFVGFLMLAVLAVIVFFVSAYISKLSDYKFLPQEEDGDEDLFSKETIERIRTPKERKRVVKEPPLVTEMDLTDVEEVRRPKKRPAPNTRKRYDFDV